VNKIFNKQEYKKFRKDLRNNLTEPEKHLWQILRKQQMGYKFRRQHGIGHYIVDFYCPQLKLVIEVDGDSHYSEEAQSHDKDRDHYMQTLGIMTIRLQNDAVMNNIEGVHQYLKEQMDLIVNQQQERQNG